MSCGTADADEGNSGARFAEGATKVLGWKRGGMAVASWCLMSRGNREVAPSVVSGNRGWVRGCEGGGGEGRLRTCGRVGEECGGEGMAITMRGMRSGSMGGAFGELETSESRI